MSARVLIAGLPGTGKGVLSSILGCSPDLDVTFASYPNKGDHDPASYDHIVITVRNMEHQIQSFRRKTGMRTSRADVVKLNADGYRQLDNIATNHGCYTWDYRRTVEWDMTDIIDHWANTLGVPAWAYTGPDIYDGDAPPPPSQPVRLQPISWDGDDG